MKNLFILMIFASMLWSCSDDESKTKATFNVRLTDAPASYEEVLIDVQQVFVHFAEENEGNGEWIEMTGVQSGVYNLLELTNGIDTLLATMEFSSGTLSQMRLVLGEDNQVKKDGEYYDLSTPAAQMSGLKFNIHAQLSEGVNYTMWLDFDAGRSIVEKGNGGFSLKPVIRTYTKATSGAIKGVVSPVEARPYVMAVSQGNDTVGTYADTVSGVFLIGGAANGFYELILSSESYGTKTIEDIEVIIGETTVVDTVIFEVER